MAKSSKPKNTKKGVNAPVTDRTLFYSDLAFMPSEMKASPLWMAQSLFNAKLNAVRFEDPKKVEKYRRINRMEIDEREYKEMLDPKTPMGHGGNAEYIASDWKECPVAVHLANILLAKLDKIAVDNKIQVNEIDKFAKSQRQKDKDKIVAQDAFRMLINEVNKDLGLPPLTTSESPYDYVKKLQGDDTTKKVDDISLLIEQIRLRMKDAPDYWALYDRYVYKGDIERAFELGIEYYLMTLNKWRVKSSLFYNDIRNFNKFCGRWVIDETTGRGNIEYISPENLFTSPFYEKNGDDIIYWFEERDITFADFLRDFAHTMTNEQISRVLELNKSNASVGSNYEKWQTWGESQRNNAMLRIGFFSVMTQEMDTFSEEYFNGNIPIWQPKESSWKPDPESDVVKQKAYNVWYSCYYVPPPATRLSDNSMADWQWQSDFIFKIEKETDMYRYGVDQRYARSSLVIYKESDIPSFTDVQEAYMPKIRNLWHKFQNCLIQDTTGTVIDWDFMTGILNATDEANKTQFGSDEKPSGSNGVDAGLKAFRMLRQGGLTFMKFRDKNGNFPAGFDPSKFFVKVDTGHLDKAEKYLGLILQQYQLLMLSVSQNDVTQGDTPKPRTPVEGIKAAIESAREGIWFVEKIARESLIMYAERVVQMILCMVKERDKYSYTKRWDEFADVVGLAQALMIEGISDLHPEDIGITVSLEDTSAMNDYIFALANEMVKNKEVSREGAILAIETAKTNYKYAFALLMMEAKKQEEKNAEMAELEHQRQMELMQQQMEIAQALQAAKTEGKVQEIGAAGKIEGMLQEQLNALKAQTQSMLKEQQTQGKLLENQQKAILERETEAQKPFGAVS